MKKKEETFDQSRDDFDMCRRTINSLLDDIIVEYEDFTNDVSPKHWRSTGHHLTLLRNIKEEIENFTPITIEEKNLEWVRKSRFDGEGEGPGKWKSKESPEWKHRKAPKPMFEKLTTTMKNIKTFELFNTTSLDIKDLKIDDTLLYQGSRCDIVNIDDYTIKVKSQQTNKEFYINQEQLNSSNVKLISSRIVKE